jgi:hypothetical protein
MEKLGRFPNLPAPGLPNVMPLLCLFWEFIPSDKIPQTVLEIMFFNYPHIQTRSSSIRGLVRNLFKSFFLGTRKLKPT